MSEVPAEPRRGQVIDLMAAFKASLEKRGVAAPTADEAKEKPATGGGARRGPKRTLARHARRRNGARGQQEVRRSYLAGTASEESITERRFVWPNRRPGSARKGVGGRGATVLAATVAMTSSMIAART